MNTWNVTEVHVTHSWRGFELSVVRVGRLRWMVGHGIEDALAWLGHPCCGRGIGRIRPIFNAAHRLLTWGLTVAEGRMLVTLPLTSADAAAVDDGVSAELADPDGLYRPLDGVDTYALGDTSYGLEWSDGRFVALHCPRCGDRIAAAIWPLEAVRRHEAECPGPTTEG